MGLRGPVPDLDDAQMRRSGATTCARSSTPCAGSCAPARRGACCRPTSRRGQAVYQQTQRWLDGRGASRRWCTICAPCCAGARGPRRPARRRSSSTAPRGKRTPESGHRRRLRRAQAAQGQQDPRGRRYAGHLLALHVTPANAQDRAQVAALAAAVQDGHRADGGGGLRRPGLHRRAGRRPTRPRTASAWRWSSCRRPSAASCCCPGAGWWSAPSPGWRASAAWPGTTNGCRKRWRACISSPSPA